MRFELKYVWMNERGRPTVFRDYRNGISVENLVGDVRMLVTTPDANYIRLVIPGADRTLFEVVKP